MAAGPYPERQRVKAPKMVTGVMHYAADLPIAGVLYAMTVSAAVTSAVFHASGKRVRKLPIRVEDLL